MHSFQMLSHLQPVYEVQTRSNDEVQFMTQQEQNGSYYYYDYFFLFTQFVIRLLIVFIIFFPSKFRVGYLL